MTRYPYSLLLSLLTLTFLPTPATWSATWYAAPGGTGNGVSTTQPASVTFCIAKSQTGDTVTLADGVYTGPAGMIALADKQGLVVQAANDGKVQIDGEGKYQPIRLSDCTGVIVEGVNACRSVGTVVELTRCANGIVRRVCAWDAADGNTSVLAVHYSTGPNLVEDCALWGTARKTASCSQGGDYTTFRRCWFRWEGSTVVGPKMALSLVYNSKGGVAEDCIGTVDTSTGRMPKTYTLLGYDGKPWTGAGAGVYTDWRVQEMYGIFSADGFTTGTILQQRRGFAVFWRCLAYMTPTARGEVGCGAFFISSMGDVTVEDCSAIVGPRKAFLLGASPTRTPTPANLTVRNIWADGPVWVDPRWTAGGVLTGVKALPFLASAGDLNHDGRVDVGDMGVMSAAWGVDYNIGNLGVLSANWGRTWTFPMDERIKAAMVQGGYPPISVSQQVQEALR